MELGRQLLRTADCFSRHRRLASKIRAAAANGIIQDLGTVLDDCDQFCRRFQTKTDHNSAGFTEVSVQNWSFAL